MNSKLCFTLCIALCLCLLEVKSQFEPTRHIRVTTIVEPPYVMIDENNTYFDGIMIRVLEEMARRLQFSYDIHLASDTQVGYEVEPGNWIGLVDQLVENKSDLAVAALFVQSNHASLVQYTQPVQLTGMKILYKLPPSVDNTMFTLLSPFSSTVWIVIVLVYMAVSILLFVIGRLSPCEHPDFYEKESTDGKPTLLSSLVYAVTSLTYQDYSKYPRSLSGRCLSGGWWVFTIFVFMIYTANMAAIIMTKAPDVRRLPFMTFDELSRQNDITYGVLNNGFWYRKLQNSKIPLEKKLWTAMYTNQNAFVSTLKEGVERVRNSSGKYAFITDEPMAAFLADKEPCDLVILGEMIYNSGFGFACRKGMVFCDDISMMILELREKGFVHKVTKQLTHQICYGTKEQGKVNKGLPLGENSGNTGIVVHAKSMTLQRFSIALILLAIGMSLSVVFVIGEIVYARHWQLTSFGRSRNGDQERISGSFGTT